MKIALLNDTHFGCRNDSPAFADYQKRFYDELFFPYMKENNIKHLVHLGDVVDRRKFINFKTANFFRQKFMKRLWEEKIDTHIILGNHDTYYKNTNEVNAISELCTTYDGQNEPWIYAGPKTVNLGGLDILFLPWICDQNYEESMYEIENSTAEICMGHLEIKGFEMHRGFMNEHGLDKTAFHRFEKVMSGHFHNKSDDGQIYYLGTQYEMMWSDYKDPKGFHIFDTDTRELTRVSNPMRIFRKIYYNDTMEDYDKVDISRFDKSFIKLFISNKTDEDMYNRFIQRIYDTLTVHDLNIFEDTTDVNTSVPETIEQGEDTTTFLNNYIDHIETDLDKGKIKEKIKELYQEANDGN